MVIGGGLGGGLGPAVSTRGGRGALMQILGGDGQGAVDGTGAMGMPMMGGAQNWFGPGSGGQTAQNWMPPQLGGPQGYSGSPDLSGSLPQQGATTPLQVNVPPGNAQITAGGGAIASGNPNASTGTTQSDPSGGIQSWTSNGMGLNNGTPNMMSGSPPNFGGTPGLAQNQQGLQSQLNAPSPLAQMTQPRNNPGSQQQGQPPPNMQALTQMLPQMLRARGLGQGLGSNLPFYTHNQPLSFSQPQTTHPFFNYGGQGGQGQMSGIAAAIQALLGQQQQQQPAQQQDQTGLQQRGFNSARLTQAMQTPVVT